MQTRGTISASSMRGMGHSDNIQRGMQEFSAYEMGYTVNLLVTGECTEFNGECSE